MSTILESALAAAASGCRVLPIPPNQKGPTLRRWPNQATTDATKIATWFGNGGEYEFGNFGIATGADPHNPSAPRLLIIDADKPKRSGDADGVASLDQMDREDLLPQTRTHRTKSGGLHKLYWIRDGGVVPKKIKGLAGFPGIDILGDGGQAVGPGSVVDGQVYEVVDGIDIAEAPAEILELIREAGGVPATKEGPSDRTAVGELDTPDRMARARSYLDSAAPEAVEGERNNTAFKVVNWVKDLGISAEQNLPMVDELWNQVKVSPPLDLDELEIIVASAYRQGNAPGIKTPPAELEFDPVEGESDRRNAAFANPKGKKLEAPTLLLMNPAALVGLPPPREWLVNGWAPHRKVTLLSGNGGTGKTLISQQLASSRAVGAAWLGRAVSPGSTLCVFSEDDEDELWRRQDDINAALGIERKQLGQVRWLAADRIPPSGWMMMSFDRENPEGRFHPFMQQVDDAMSEHRFKLLILDAAANVFGGDEINRNQVTTFVNRALNKLCSRHDASVILLAHPSVAGMADGSGRSGSTGWANACRARLYLTRLPKKLDATGDLRHLSTTKANYGKEGEAVTMRWSRGQFEEVVGGPDILATANSQVYSVLQQIEAAGLRPTLSPTGPSSVASLVRNHPDGSHLDKATVDAAVRRLLDMGMLAERPYIGANRIEAKHNMIFVTGTGADAETHDDGFGD